MASRALKLPLFSEITFHRAVKKLIQVLRGVTGLSQFLLGCII